MPLTENAVGIGVTGLGWLGGGTGSAQNLVREVVLKAEHEILLTVYSITHGGDEVLSWIGTRAAMGVRAVIIVDHLSAQTGGHHLTRLADRFPGRIELFDHRDAAALHAKCLVVDRAVAVVGSANLSRNGMVASHELVMRIDGPAADEIAALIDRLRLSALTTRVR